MSKILVGFALLATLALVQPAAAQAATPAVSALASPSQVQALELAEFLASLGGGCNAECFRHREPEPLRPEHLVRGPEGRMRAGLRPLRRQLRDLLSLHLRHLLQLQGLLTGR